MNGNRRAPRAPFRAAAAAARWRATLILSAAGLTLAFSVAIGVLFGYWLDQRFKTTWWTPLVAILGVIAGFRELIRAVKNANAAQEEADRERKAAAEEEGNRDDR